MTAYRVPVWNEAPFLRLVLPFASGILVQSEWRPHQATGWSILITSTFLLIAFGYIGDSGRFAYGWVRGILVNGCFISLAMLNYQFLDPSQQRDAIQKHYRPGKMISGCVEQPWAKKGGRWVSTVSEVRIQNETHWISVQGSVQVMLEYSPDPSLAALPEPGHYILFLHALQEVRNTGNPGSFDYRRYMNMQQVCCQVFLRSGEYAVWPGKRAAPVKLWLAGTREKILNLLKRNIEGEKETGLAEALLIGYRYDLDKDLAQSYANTGVTHIIAISGLHLALIFGFLKWLFRPLSKKIVGRWLAVLAILVSLWAFSFLSGASPSVLRAAVMYSGAVIGGAASRTSSIYNSLSASCLLLLCFNPFWLWDLGFQLSYAALLSIVMFYRPIRQCLSFRHKAVDMVWQSAALTLSAQVLTTPISIFRFHRFPVYFLPTNLIAVPLSSLILMGTLLLCAFGGIPVLAKFTGLLVSRLISYLNSYVESISGLPFASLDHLQISWQQSLLLYLAIAGFALWMKSKSSLTLWIVLLSVTSFLILRFRSFLHSCRQQWLVVYNIPRRQAIECIRGRAAILYCDTVLYSNQVGFSRYLEPSRSLFRIKKSGAAISMRPLSFFCWAHSQLVILDAPLKKPRGQAKIPVDVLVISGGPEISIPVIVSVFDVKQWVFDRSNPSLKVREWKAACRDLGFDFHDLSEEGAFVIQMD